jgi:hypothetical protein
MVAFGNDPARWESLAGWRARFKMMLPEIERRARQAFHGVGPDQFEELVSEVTERAFHVFSYLAQRGKADLAYARPLAMSAIKQVRTARRVTPLRRF